MKFLFLLLLVGGCVNYRIDQSETGPVTISNALLDSVSYAQVKAQVFDKSCTTCHGNSGEVNLESYSAAYQHLAQIEASTLKGGGMPKPPVPPLTRAQREILTAWIQAGGPDRARNGSGGNVPEPVELKPTYESIRKNIIEKKCLFCHTTGGEAARIPFNTREDLIDSPLEVVIPGNTEDSGILIVLESGSRKFMPPTTSGISPATEEEKNVIREWIKNGAL